METWGNTCRTSVNPNFISQKRAIRIIKKVDYYEPTNALFINLYTLKFWDIVNLQTLLILYKAHNNLLPASIQRLFETKETKYELRNAAMFEPNRARTNTRKHCVTVKGVRLWQGCEKDAKMCRSIYGFKKMYKCNVIKKYRELL